MTDDRLVLDAALVARLVAAQFPHWAGLSLRPVEPAGWDNRTFRLGDELSVRLPSHRRYVAAVEKEHRWLPVLAPRLPLPIPVPLARGQPGAGYPFPWSVYRWLPGAPATPERIADPVAFARDLAAFLIALQAIDATDGPAAGDHNFWRGGPLGVYDAEARRAIDALAGEIDRALATDAWEAALAAPWPGPPVWIHGDVAFGNLLVLDGRLCAVIDFGTSAVGDPACDTVVAWTLLTGAGRDAFRAALPLDPETWARGRGWALWKALITLAWSPAPTTSTPDDPRRVLADVLAEHRALA